jgi:hypothetical protein
MEWKAGFNSYYLYIYVYNMYTVVYLFRGKAPEGVDLSTVLVEVMNRKTRATGLKKLRRNDKHIIEKVARIEMP